MQVLSISAHTVLLRYYVASAVQCLDCVNLGVREMGSQKRGKCIRCKRAKSNMISALHVQKTLRLFYTAVQGIRSSLRIGPVSNG